MTNYGISQMQQYLPGYATVTATSPSTSTTTPAVQPTSGGISQVASNITPAMGVTTTPTTATASDSAARNADFATGQARWDALIAANPEYAANMARYKDLSQGLNAQEMLAAREGMAAGQNSATNNAMRGLYSAQARSGVRGGMAGAQAGRIARQGMQDRTAAEQKLLLDNYALKTKGLENYSNQVNAGIAGQLATGTGEAQLGVADRTNTYQQAINQAMLNQSQRSSGGFLSSVFNSIF